MESTKADSIRQAKILANHRRRTIELQRARRGSRYFALSLGALVLTIYGFSMYKIKQETILNDIDEEIAKTK